MNPYALLSLISFLVSLFLGIYVLQRNPRGDANRAYAILMMFVALWTFGEFMIRAGLGNFSLWSWIAALGVVFFPAGFFHLTSVFPRESIGKSYRIPYVFSFIFLFLITTPYFVIGFKKVYWGYVFVPGDYFPIFAIYFFGVMVIGISLLVRNCLRMRGPERESLRLLIFGVLFGFTIGFFTDVIAPLLQYEVVGTASTFSLLNNIIIAYLILKYRIMIEPKAERITKAKPTYDLRRGFSYFIKEETLDFGPEVFLDLVTHGVEGLYVTRKYPKRLRERYNLQKIPFIWITSVESAESIQPEYLEKLIYYICEFLKRARNSAVYIDCLSYLIVQNDFQTVLKFLHSLNDHIVLNNSRLLISLDSKALSVKEMSLLEKEFETLEIFEVVRPEDIDKFKTRFVSKEFR
ncbi:MAG: DUF835 domain-containing protein [Candidatus Methanofastidiosia archaeon]